MQCHKIAFAGHWTGNILFSSSLPPVDVVVVVVAGEKLCRRVISNNIRCSAIPSVVPCCLLIPKCTRPSKLTRTWHRGRFVAGNHFSSTNWLSVPFLSLCPTPPLFDRFLATTRIHSFLHYSLLSIVQEMRCMMFIRRTRKTSQVCSHLPAPPPVEFVRAQNDGK